MTPAYWSDMEVVDKRLTKLEKCYEEISQLLASLSIDIKHIIGGSDGIAETKEQNAVKDSKR